MLVHSTIENMQENAEFVKITNAGMSESHAHDVTITKEAPNYSRDNDSKHSPTPYFNYPILGSQYAQLIARRVRECGVYCELMHPNISEEKIRAFNPSGIILSGGPETVIETHTPRAPKIIFELGVPVLGICYGMQTMAAQLGGEVESSDKKEFGYASCEIDSKNPLFQGISDAMIDVWMSHGDHVTRLPNDFQSYRAITKHTNCSDGEFVKKFFCSAVSSRSNTYKMRNATHQ